MVSKGPGRQGSRWRRAQAECMHAGAMNNTPCWLCGQPINYEMTKVLHLHPLAGTAHHIVGLAEGGDPLDPANLVPAHRRCNSVEGNRVRLSKRVSPWLAGGDQTSRRW